MSRIPGTKPVCVRACVRACVRVIGASGQLKGTLGPAGHCHQRLSVGV